ncbi:MAG: hypothetical protein K8I00_02530 [Candidatus Omnitrophica bacterium]|nr:hypothetical protein [Candidatus Omnitrophota bacterium]
MKKLIILILLLTAAAATYRWHRGRAAEWQFQRPRFQEFGEYHDKKFTGHRIWYHDNGYMSTYVNIKNDKWNGPAARFTYNGTLWEEERWVDSKQNGLNRKSGDTILISHKHHRIPNDI